MFLIILYLDWLVGTPDIKAEPRRGAVEIVEDPREYVAGGPQALTALPDHLHGLVLDPLVLVVVVNAGKEEPVHAQLERKERGGKGLKLSLSFSVEMFQPYE